MFSPAQYSRVLQRSASTWERRCAINGSRALSTSKGVWGETTTLQPARATSVGSMSTGKPRNGRVNRFRSRFSHPECSRSSTGRISLATDSADSGGTRYSPVTPSMPLRKNWSSLMVVLDDREATPGRIRGSLHGPDPAGSQVAKSVHDEPGATKQLGLFVLSLSRETGSLEVVAADHRRFEELPLIGAVPDFQADEGMTGYQDQGRVQ